MSKDFIDNEIDEAHDLIKHGDFEQAVMQLKDIKLRVHDKEILDSIKKFENEHDSVLEQRLREIEKSTVDPLRKQSQIFEQLSNYARSYLSFYDKLRKEYEIY